MKDKEKTNLDLIESMNKPYKVYKISSNKTAIYIAVLVIGLALQTQGYCDGATQSTASEMDTMATNLVNTIFAPWVRKTALAFGGGWGMFQSISGGSFKPLLVWGGIGIFVNFIPKIIGWFGI